MAHRKWISLNGFLLAKIIRYRWPVSKYAVIVVKGGGILERSCQKVSSPRSSFSVAHFYLSITPVHICLTVCSRGSSLVLYRSSFTYKKPQSYCSLIYFSYISSQKKWLCYYLATTRAKHCIRSWKYCPFFCFTLEYSYL